MLAPHRGRAAHNRVPNELVDKDSLTAFGQAVVRECQRLGIIVDLTHLPERAFFQALELSRKPLIVSHGTGRELGEKRIKALAATGGVIGLHFYTSYLGERPAVLQVVEAVDYLARQVGVAAVGLGVDFFPSAGAWRDFQQTQGTKEPAWAIPSLGHFAEVTAALASRRYADEEIRGILGGHFLRVCQAVFGS